MATARDVVYRALRLLGVTASGTDPTSEEADDALETLNAMLKGWEARGVDVNHDADYALSTTFETATLTSAYTPHVTALLAVELAPEYEAGLTPSLAEMARAGWTTIQANFLVSADLTIDKGLRKMPSQYWGATRYR